MNEPAIAPRTQHPKPVVCLPSFNNASFLKAVLEGVRASGLPILLVDDGSTDDTPAILAEASLENPLLKVIRHKTNQGKAAALRTAFVQARRMGFTHAISMDTDGQHFAEDLQRFEAALLACPGTLLLGCRDFEDHRAGRIPRSSRFGRAFSDFWIWVETGHKVLDSQCGFRAYPLQNLPLGRASGFAWEVEVLTEWLWAGGKVATVPIRVLYPENRISHFHQWRDNTQLSLLHTRLCLKGWSLRLWRRLWPWAAQKEASHGH